MSRHIRWLIFIIILAGFALWVSLPDTQSVIVDNNFDGEPEFQLNITQSLGLDLVGGLRVLLKADLPASAYTAEDLQQTANNVSRRVNALGVTEATIQVLQGSGRLLVELPGVTDPQQAIETIQQTALLEFVDFSGIPGGQFDGQKILTTEQVLIRQQREAAALEATLDPTAEDEVTAPEPLAIVHPQTGQPFQTVMTGAGLQAAIAEYDPNSQSWHIAFDLTAAGSEVFGPYTAANVGEPMAIVFDGVVLSAPVIQAQLDTGGVITGSFDEDEAKTLAFQLRSGALPIPLSVETSEQVGATLGQESVTRSIQAGVIGVIVVLTFMLVYYRVPGMAADLALLVFILLNFAIFKLVPVTLTLPSITGFLISIGTAVDGNILIFERIKEEVRVGRDLKTALVSGFNRAWASIRDSNLSTIIICGILFLFGQTPGASIVSGFAVTLALGLIINLFTAVIVTRTFLNILVALLYRPLTARKWLLGV